MSSAKTGDAEKEQARERTCAQCRHLLDDPAGFERALPGILILSSGQGASRGDQGICRVHLQLVAPTMGCNRFQRGTGE